MVVYACNPNTLGGRGGWSPEVSSLRPALPTWWNTISTKNTKISCVWWQAPVIPATQEAETGESLEPRRWRLQWAIIMPPYWVTEWNPVSKNTGWVWVAHACNPNTLRGWSGRIPRAQEFRPPWATQWDSVSIFFFLSKTNKNKKFHDPFVVRKHDGWVHKHDDWVFTHVCEMCFPQSLLQFNHYPPDIKTHTYTYTHTQIQTE